jgi:DnaJ-class molecular chaperone
MSKKPDYYEVLGIAKKASVEEIKAAYRSASLKYHPDRLRNKSEAEKNDAAKKFQLATEAHTVLTDASKRSIYDQYGHQGLENIKNTGNDQSYADAAGPLPTKKPASTMDVFDFFEKRAGGGNKTPTKDSGGLSSEEIRKKNAEDRIKNRGQKSNDTSSTKETFNETAEKLGDAAESLKGAGVSIEDLQRIRDKAADLLKEVDAAIVRARKNNGPQP